MRLIALCAVLALAGCAQKGSSPGESAAALNLPIQAGSAVIQPTLVTVDLDTVSDCTSLAGALVPLFDSLGDLTGEQASQIDSAIIGEIGAHMDALEAKRVAMGCDEAQWKIDSCAAMASGTSPMAQRFSGSQCEPAG